MNNLLESAKAVLAVYGKALAQDCASDLQESIDKLRKAVQEAEAIAFYDSLPESHKTNASSVLMDRKATTQEITDIEDFIAKTSNFTPMNLFKNGESGSVNVGGYGINLKNGIPVTVSVDFEVFDVVPKGKVYTPMTDDELMEIDIKTGMCAKETPWAYERNIESAVIARLGLVWGEK